MWLQKLQLINFKNYSQVRIDFNDKLICLTGENGAGKTNLLDAIHYLSLTKSAFNGVDQQNVHHGQPFFSIIGKVEKQGRKHDVKCIYQGQKSLVVDEQPYHRLSDHVGEFPVVFIAPNDTDLIREASDTRRKFFDSHLSQIDKEYLVTLIQYNRYLKQRNHLLKQLNDRRVSDKELLVPYNIKIINLGQALYARRKKFLEELSPAFNHYYKTLSNDKEQVSLHYKSHYDGDISQKFEEAQSRDMVLQRTTVGAHRDDFVFSIGQHPIKKFGSQGQQKSFIIALKLAQYDHLKSNKNFPPFLLLDDIFDKLDESRIEQLTKLIMSDHFGQIFLTDARVERTDRYFRGQPNVSILHIKDNQITSITSHEI